MNYCGPFYFPEFIKKMLSKRFNYACKLHDERYNNKEIPRKLVDKIFLDSMLLVSVSKWDIFIAHTYYILVRVFGGISWYFSKA